MKAQNRHIYLNKINKAATPPEFTLLKSNYVASHMHILVVSISSVDGYRRLGDISSNDMLMNHTLSSYDT